MDEFKAQTEFGIRNGWELRWNSSDGWGIWGKLPGDPGLIANGAVLEFETTLWLSLPAALTTPEPVVEEPKLPSDLADFLERLRAFGAEGFPRSSILLSYRTQRDLDALDALGLVHTVLDGDRVLFVAGQPETACGRMVAGAKP